MTADGYGSLGLRGRSLGGVRAGSAGNWMESIKAPMKTLAQFSERHPVLLMPEEWEEMLNPELRVVEGVILPWKRKEGTGTVTSVEGSMENWRSSGHKAERPSRETERSADDNECAA